MTERDFTEAEIMKALECACLYQTTDVRTYKGIPIEEFSKAVLDLINRKNAECKECGIRTSECIEKLQKQIAEKNAECKEYKERFEMLDSNSQMAIGYADALEERARAEAAKEFAESLKHKMFSEDYLLCEPCDMADIIDQIAKEMGVE